MVKLCCELKRNYERIRVAFNYGLLKTIKQIDQAINVANNKLESHPKSNNHQNIDEYCCNCRQKYNKTCFQKLCRPRILCPNSYT